MNFRGILVNERRKFNTALSIVALGMVASHCSSQTNSKSGSASFSGGVKRLSFSSADVAKNMSAPNGDMTKFKNQHPKEVFSMIDSRLTDDEFVIDGHTFSNLKTKFHALRDDFAAIGLNYATMGQFASHRAGSTERLTAVDISDFAQAAEQQINGKGPAYLADDSSLALLTVKKCGVADGSSYFCSKFEGPFGSGCGSWAAATLASEGAASPGMVATCSVAAVAFLCDFGAKGYSWISCTADPPSGSKPPVDPDFPGARTSTPGPTDDPSDSTSPVDPDLSGGRNRVPASTDAAGQPTG